jgi:hypothetical protein
MVERVKLESPYRVGYGKPPKQSRFTKGRSGNPRGRPKGSRNLATMIIEELTRTVSVVENGKRTKVPKIRVAVRQALNRAMAGDFKALHQIINMLRSHDVLKRVDLRRSTKMNVPLIQSSHSLEEAVKLYQMTLDSLGDLEN